ncbi:MAG: hypothetical protein BWK77_06885, partial [Verrucomicrobia bacterium A1]
MENIVTNYSGVDNAEKLRNFLIDAYNTWGTDYVLLGGDIGVVPMRKLWCTAAGEEDLIPSDLYYQCLNGNYNNDGDDRWGEPTDGPGGADVDLVAELYIGRASAENPAEMENFVFKTLAYENENESSPHLRTALMCGEHLGFGGVSEYAWQSMDEIRYGSDSNGYTTTGFAASELFTVDTLYDREGYTWAKADLIALINSGAYSIINHLGHANYNYVMKFYNADADALTNSAFVFAYSQGCIPGNYEVDCVAEHLTTSTRHGMFAVVFNSRYGWGRYNSTDGPSQRFDRQFWDGYFGKKLVSIGALNANSHEANLWDLNGSCIRWCYYESNLLGDPQTPMRGQFISDTILMSPLAGFNASGAEGGPFAPSVKDYVLLCTATNDPLAWSASCTQSWVTLSATNGSLSAGEQGVLTASINANADALPEGEYFDTITFSNVSNGKGSTNRIVHLVVNNPPVVTNSSVQQGDLISAGNLSLTLQFNEPMMTSNLDPSDFALVGEVSGLRTPTAWAYEPDGLTLTLDYGETPEDRYVLTLFSGEGRFEDDDGFALDGETPSWPLPPNRSGNGIAGGDFSVAFELDATTVGYPVPLQPKEPLGSLIYDPFVTAFITPAADTDRYTIAVNTGQTMTVVIRPDTNLQPSVQLFEPWGSLAAEAVGATAGAAAVIQTARVWGPGTYAMVVSGSGVSTGRYSLQVILNAAQEEEDVGGSSNNTLAAAQSIEDSFIPLVNGADRGAVLGTAEGGPLVELLDQDFESGLAGFTISNSFDIGNGLWHVSSGRGGDSGHTASSSLYYGHNEGPEGGGDYDNGLANAGAFFSPAIGVFGNGDIDLSFNHYLETEGLRRWDFVEVAMDVGDGFRTVLSSTNATLPTGTDGLWTNMTVRLPRLSGTNIVLRFSFDTVDSALNGYEGWYVDDLSVKARAEGAPDFYSFALSAGDTVTLMATELEGYGLTLQLLDDVGSVLAESQTSADASSASIQDFTSVAGGTYYARVTGREVQYSLVVIRNADFAVEPNDTLAAARPIDGQALVLGAVAGPAAPINSESEPNDDRIAGWSTNDAALANDWTGSFTNAGDAAYQASLTGDISSGSDADWDVFRIVAAPGDSILISLDGVSLDDPYLWLFDRAGTILKSDNDGGDGMNSRISHGGFPYAGDYYVVADAYGSDVGTYRLAATLTTTNLWTGEDRDCLRVNAVAGDELTVRTWTPGGITNQFANNLDPAVDLLKNDGTILAANDNGAPDGRNAALSNLIVRTTSYVVRVRSAQRSGEYLVSVTREPGPPVVSFDAVWVTAPESQPLVVLPVTLSAATSEVATVNYSVAGGTAAGGGVDYSLAAGTLTFSPGQVATSVVIALVNDSAPEGTETIRVRLSNPVHANLGEFPTQTVVIVDDELPLRLQFSSAACTVAEQGTSAVIAVTRAGGNDGSVTVDYSTSDGTAVAGVDYQSATGVLVLADGVASKTFQVPIEFDMNLEPDETVNLSLAGATGGAVLGSPSNAVLTILDYKFSRANILLNGGFENPANSNDFNGTSWSGWGLAYREGWAAHSGNRGACFQGWVADNYGGLYQWVNAGRGTYTFSVWVRQEPGFFPYLTTMDLYWYDADWVEIQPETSVYFTAAPRDSEWHHWTITGTCTNTSLAHVEAGIFSYWGAPVGSPSAIMFDDASLC